MRILIVSRHAGAIQWLTSQCAVTPILIPHLDTTRVRVSDHVVGTLPLHLAAQVCRRGAFVWHLCLTVPAHLRGCELNAVQMADCQPELVRFDVRAAFVNRRRTQLKCLYFEAGGYCVWSKRLETGRFGIHRAASTPAVALSRTAFEGLIEGLELVIKKHRKRWHPGVSRASSRV